MHRILNQQEPDRRITLTARCLFVCAYLMTIGAGCQHITDMVGPFDHSETSVEGSVIDSLTGKGIAGVNVLLNDGSLHSDVTDTAGIFRLNNIATGSRTVRLKHEDFKECAYPVECTLDAVRETYSLVHRDSPPAIRVVMIDTASMHYHDDSVKMIFTATDVSGGIKRIDLLPGNGSESVTVFEEPVYSFTDTAVFRYDSVGVYSGYLSCTDGKGETSVDTFTITTPPVRRPRFVLIRPGEDGFISGHERYLSILIDDPDTVMNRMSIDWGDGSDSMITTETYWAPVHAYKISGSGTFTYNVTLRIFSDSVMVADSVYALPVQLVDSIKLEKNMFFKPGDYLDPSIAEIRIGVRVAQIANNQVAKIIWIINENDPDATFISHLQTYEGIEGIIDPERKLNLFTHVFSTENMKRVNEVTIKVFDEYNNSATIFGSFIIAGKSGG